MQKAKVTTAWVMALVGSLMPRKVRCMKGPIISGDGGAEHVGQREGGEDAEHGEATWRPGSSCRDARQDDVPEDAERPAPTSRAASTAALVTPPSPESRIRTVIGMLSQTSPITGPQGVR